MILRRLLTVVGWSVIAFIPLFAVWGVWSTFNLSKISGQPVEASMLVSALAGIVPTAIACLGFGGMSLMLVSIDRRLAHLEGRA